MLYVYFIDVLATQTEADFKNYVDKVMAKVYEDRNERRNKFEKSNRHNFVNPEEGTDVFALCTNHFNDDNNDRLNIGNYISMKDKISYLRNHYTDLNYNININHLDNVTMSRIETCRAWSIFDDILKSNRDPCLLNTCYLLSHFDFTPLVGYQMPVKLVLTYLYSEQNQAMLNEFFNYAASSNELADMIPRDKEVQLWAPFDNQYSNKDYYQYYNLETPNKIAPKNSFYLAGKAIYIKGSGRCDTFSIPPIPIPNDYYDVNLSSVKSSPQTNVIDTQSVKSDNPSDLSTNSTHSDSYFLRQKKTKRSFFEEVNEVKYQRKKNESTADISPVLNSTNLSVNKGNDWDLASRIPVLAASSKVLGAIANTSKYFDYVTANSPSDVERDLFFARTAVLKHTERNWGIFTNKLIRKNAILGFYEGDIVSLNNRKKLQYTFELNDVEGIDASKKRNWTAFVNSPGAEFSANIIAKKYTTPDGIEKIAYQSLKTINPEEQLLVYYDNSYTFDRDEKRFLNCTNNDLDSQQILEENASLYSSNPLFLPSDAYNCFSIPTSTQFRVPEFDIQIPLKNINAPILATDTNGQVLPQCKQENITPLMLAILNKDMALIAYLLDNGVDPNIQTSYRGFTALHVLMKSSLSLPKKKEIFQTLIKHNAQLHLQNDEEQTAFHEAIATKNLDLVKYVYRNKKEKSNLFNYENNNKLDPFLYSISLNAWNIARYIFDELKDEDIMSYFIEESQFNCFSECLSNINDDTSGQTITKKLIERLHSIEGSAQNVEYKERIEAWFNEQNSHKSFIRKH